MEALQDFLRFWVAFSVVDEGCVGSVSIGDLKASGLPRCVALADVRQGWVPDDGLRTY